MGVFFANGGSIVTDTSSIKFDAGIPRSVNGQIPYVLAVNTSGTTAYTTVGRIQNWTTIYNDGNHFNATTGLFTAPITGQYFIYNWFMCSNNAAYVNKSYTIRRNQLNTSQNNADTVYVYNSSTTSVHKQFTGGSIFRLSANDTLSVHNENLSIYMSSSLYTRLSIIYLGVG